MGLTRVSNITLSSPFTTMRKWSLRFPYNLIYILKTFPHKYFYETNFYFIYWTVTNEYSISSYQMASRRTEKHGDVVNRCPTTHRSVLDKDFLCLHHVHTVDKCATEVFSRVARLYNKFENNWRILRPCPGRKVAVGIISLWRTVQNNDRPGNKCQSLDI